MLRSITVLILITFAFLIPFTLFAGGTITSVVATDTAYYDFDDVVVALTAKATYDSFLLVTYRPQKNFSGQWTNLTSQNYYGPLHTWGSWRISNESFNVFRAEDYYGNSHPTLINPAGNGTYRVKVEMTVDTNSTISGFSGSFSVNDTVAPGAPAGLSRSVVNAPSNNPKIRWNRNPEGDVHHYQIWKKRGEGNWSILDTTSTDTQYVDLSETGASIRDIANSITVYYKIKAVDFTSNQSGYSATVYFAVPDSVPDRAKVNSIPTTEIEVAPVPNQFALLQNYPNPFNPSTNIQFVQPEAGQVELAVFSITGEKIATLIKGYSEKGLHSIRWNGLNDLNRQVTSGIYIYTLRAVNYQETRKMILLK